MTLAGLSGCGSANSAPPESKVTLHGSGATFPFPLYKKWIEQFQRADAQVRVDYDAVGTGKGIDQFLSGKVDFAGSDRALSNDQLTKVERGVLFVPTAAGMIGLAYNPQDLPKDLKLKRDVYVDIFLGKIKNWNDPRIAASNPGFEFPNLTISLVVRQDSSGTTYAFTNHLGTISETWKVGPGVGTKVAWPGSARQAAGNEGVGGAIKNTIGAIGYVEYGLANRLGMPMAALENKDGRFVAPQPTAAQAALASAPMPENFRLFIPDPSGTDSYPIVTYTWILAYREHTDPKKAEACKQFLLWCLKEGQGVNESLGFVALPQNIAKDVIDAIGKLPTT